MDSAARSAQRCHPGLECSTFSRYDNHGVHTLPHVNCRPAGPEAEGDVRHTLASAPFQERTVTQIRVSFIPISDPKPRASPARNGWFHCRCTEVIVMWERASTALAHLLTARSLSSPLMLGFWKPHFTASGTRYYMVSIRRI